MSSVIDLKRFYRLLNHEQSDNVQNTGHFNIFKVEDLSLPNHRPVNYSRRDFFKISLVKGHSKVHYADRSIEVTGSVLVFTNPMIPFFWEHVSTHQTGYVCIFTEAFFNRFSNIKDYPVFQNAENGIVTLTEQESTQFESIFSRMYDELQGDYVYKYDLLRNLLMEAVHMALKMKPVTGNKQTGPNAAERIAGLFVELLERQYPIELSNQALQLRTPSQFAEKLNIHINHLNKALKEITGHTTSQLINNRLLQEAKVLLKSTNWTVSEIAWSLGFEEPNHFSSFFKNRLQITPNRFRQSSTD